LFVEVEALDLVVRVDGDGVLLSLHVSRSVAGVWSKWGKRYLEVLTRIVACVHGILVLARV
jgi:hypothetical protein